MAYLSTKHYLELWELLEEKYEISSNNKIAFTKIYEDLIDILGNEGISENTIKNAYYLYKYLNITKRTVKALSQVSGHVNLHADIFLERFTLSDINNQANTITNFYSTLSQNEWTGYYYDNEGLKSSHLSLDISNGMLILTLPEGLIYTCEISSLLEEGHCIDLHMDCISDSNIRLLTRFDVSGNFRSQNIFIGMYLLSKKNKIIAGTFILRKVKPEDEPRLPAISSWESIYPDFSDMSIPSYLYSKAKNKIKATSGIYSRGQFEQWIRDKRPKMTDIERLSGFTGRYHIVYIKRSGKLSFIKELELRQITIWDFSATLFHVMVREKNRTYISSDLSLINYALFITLAYENDRVQLSCLLRKHKAQLQNGSEIEFLKGDMIASYSSEEGIGKYEIILIKSAPHINHQLLEEAGTDIMLQNSTHSNHA